MPTVLAISSFAAASRVGLSAAVPVYNACQIAVIAVPTVTLGRHPGWGPPGGGAVPDKSFESLMAAVAEHPDADRISHVVTGYFASPGQVDVTARVIEALKRRAPGLAVTVDPIMGDVPGGLYVPPAVAVAVRSELLPLATLIAPNAWEAEHLTGEDATAVEGAAKAARALGKPALISSVRRGGRIGAIWATPRETLVADAPMRTSAPKGTGDLLTAVAVACLMRGEGPRDALAATIGVVEAMLALGEERGLAELPVDALPAILATDPRASVESLTSSLAG